MCYTDIHAGNNILNIINDDDDDDEVLIRFSDFKLMNDMQCLYVCLCLCVCVSVCLCVCVCSHVCGTLLGSLSVCLLLSLADTSGNFCF